MIKVTKKAAPKSSKDKYPCLMIGNAGSIVIMTH